MYGTNPSVAEEKNFKNELALIFDTQIDSI